MVNHIFVGIDLGDKNSVARIAVNQGKTERWGFVNDRRGRERLYDEVRRRSEKVENGQIVMAYEASSCGFILHDEAEARGIRCEVLAPTKMEKSVEQRQHKNDDRGHLSRKLCLKPESYGSLKPRLKHGIQLRQHRIDTMIGSAPLTILE